MEIYDVVIKLIGPVMPIGETNADEKRFENLKTMTELVDALLSDIDAVATANKDRYEASRKKAGQFAAKFFDQIGVVE
jgi:hypothetical protein